MDCLQYTTAVLKYCLQRNGEKEQTPLYSVDVWNYEGLISKTVKPCAMNKASEQEMRNSKAGEG